jgi:integrase
MTRRVLICGLLALSAAVLVAQPQTTVQLTGPRSVTHFRPLSWRRCHARRSRRRLTRDRVIKAVRGSQRAAGLVDEGVHLLRHTFCSHLAMEGATIREIQELAGHADLSTTHRYMHLSPKATDNAIRLLDGRHRQRGGIVEAASVAVASD